MQRLNFLSDYTVATANKQQSNCYSCNGFWNDTNDWLIGSVHRRRDSKQRFDAERERAGELAKLQYVRGNRDGCRRSDCRLCRRCRHHRNLFRSHWANARDRRSPRHIDAERDDH